MRLSFELNPDLEAPSRAREAIRPLGRHMSSSALDDLTLILTELVANSVKYGPARGIEVDITIDDNGLIRGEVRDQGGEGVVAIREAVADDDGGFGLRLVDRLADRWGVYEGSTNVWFEVPAQR